MAVSAGTVATVHVSTDGVTYNLLGKLKTGDLSVENTEIDSTTNDDAGATSRIYGNQSASLSLTCAYDPADAQQTTMINATYNKTTLYYRVRPTVGSGLRQAIFQGIITNQSTSPSNNALIEITWTIQSTGAITNSTQ